MIKTEKVTVSGHVKLNGIVDSAHLSVYFGDYGLEVRSHGASNGLLSLYTFSRAMPNALNFALIANPIEYEITGTRLGLYTQNFGDAREPDFFNRVIKSVKICIIHDRQSVTYSIQGLAVVPDGVAARSESQPSGDWNFDLLFKVPREDMERFYGLTSTARDSYFNHMDGL